MLELTESQKLFYSVLKKENWFIDERRSGKTVFSSYILNQWLQEPNNRILYVGFQPSTIKNLLEYVYGHTALSTTTDAIKYRTKLNSHLDVFQYVKALYYLGISYTHILVDEVSVLDRLSKNDFNYLIKDNVFVGVGTIPSQGHAFQRVSEILKNPTIQLEVNLYYNKGIESGFK